MNRAVFLGVLFITFFGSLRTVSADDFRLAVDMNAKKAERVSIAPEQGRAPASIAGATFYSVGFDADHPIFPKILVRETNRTYRAMHPVGLQRQISDSRWIFSLYALPTSRLSTAPYGDSTFKVNSSSLEHGGFAIGFLF